MEFAPISVHKTMDIPPWKSVKWHTVPWKPTDITETVNTAEAAETAETANVAEWSEDTFPFIQAVEQLKASIQPYDNTDTWDLAKRITNPYELLYTTSSRLKLPRSTCCLQPLSRSFFKMIEMLHILTFFDRHTSKKLKSLHICEGPGGFIEAFMHMAEQQKRFKPNMFAMTLKSTHMIIPGWRRATAFLQKHKNISLLYGPTRTGDIYEPLNQQACVDAVAPFGAHLVTADGGFDFSEDFFAQEKAIFPLFVSSAIIALKSVMIEGDVVIKLFDCNSQATRDVLALLASCFHEWTLYKPTTSRPCNSEWYFLGKSAIRQRDVAIGILEKIRDTKCSTSILKENPLTDVLRSLQKERVEKQENSLQRVLFFCKETHTSEQLEEYWREQRVTSIRWCHTFHLPTLFRLKED